MLHLKNEKILDMNEMIREVKKENVITIETELK